MINKVLEVKELEVDGFEQDLFVQEVLELDEKGSSTEKTVTLNSK